MSERWVRITIDGVSALAALYDADAPNASAALWDALPIDEELVHTRWSGAAAAFATSGALDAVALEDPVCSLYPGVLAIRPGSGEALLSYGAAEARSELGVEYAVRVARVVDGAALLARLHRMHEQGDARIRIERASAPPPRKASGRVVEVEVEGTKARYALNTEGAPRTSELLWNMLPIETTTFYSRWAGDSSVVDTFPEGVGALLEGELEAPALSMYKGTLCCGPTPKWMDIYLSFGGSECRAGRGHRYVTVAGEVQGDATELFAVLKRTRKEGEKRVTIRRVE